MPTHSGTESLNLIANGMGTEEIIRDYPYLEPEDIRQALQYAAWLAEDSLRELPLKASEKNE